MTDLRKAAEEALDYIKDIRDHCACEGIECEKEDGLVEALRQALAQPEQTKPSDFLVETYSVELGSWSVTPDRGVKITHVPTGTVVSCDSEHSQHANKRLAMQKLEAALAQPEQDHGFDRTASHMAGEYVDTAEQEPVASLYILATGDREVVDWKCELPAGHYELYPEPVSKPWVDLSDDEISRVWHKHLWESPSPHKDFARAIEAALRSKNT